MDGCFCKTRIYMCSYKVCASYFVIQWKYVDNLKYYLFNNIDVLWKHVYVVHTHTSNC